MEFHGPGDDDDFVPLDLGEQKILTARRERSDKISKLLGDYMLKGYKMLATTCPDCDAIELQDRSGQVYCVGCAEVDNVDGAKDERVRPWASQHRDSQDLESVPPFSGHPRVPREEQKLKRLRSSTEQQVQQALDESIATVTEKLSWATSRLASSSSGDSLETNMQVVRLIKECAECLTALKKA